MAHKIQTSHPETPLFCILLSSLHQRPQQVPESRVLLDAEVLPVGGVMRAALHHQDDLVEVRRSPRGQPIAAESGWRGLCLA